MAKVTRLEIHKLTERYIGSSGGYLGTFGSHPELLRFYVDCGLDVLPTDYPGTNKDRFLAILGAVEPADQAKIIRGILKRHPPEVGDSRTQELHDEFLLLAQSLEAGAGVTCPTPAFTSDFVEGTLNEVEHAINTQRVTSGVDRVHSALHGYLRLVCDKAKITYVEKDRIEDLFKKIRTEHAAFADLEPRPQDIELITNSFCAILNVIDPIRNRASFAHPTKQVLALQEAALVINVAKTIFHYVAAKLAAVA